MSNPTTLQDGAGLAAWTAELPPMPIVVGARRSGTTLLRLMLDAHPQLSIPPETHFVPAAADLNASDEPLVERFLEIVTGSERWVDLDLSREELAAELAGLDRPTPADCIRATYRLYARRFGKERYGDKTPDYSLQLEPICNLLPEARIVHVIRDGRDAALSVRNTSFGPSEIGALASDWCRRVRSAREWGEGSSRYREVRYEDLVMDPRAELEEICSFIDLGFDEAMLRYHQSASERLDEFKDLVGSDATVVSREERLRIHRRAATPPDPSRIQIWRGEMTRGEVSRFERVAGALLEELGYDSQSVRRRLRRQGKQLRGAVGGTRRRVASRRRQLPGYLIIGAQKAGTSSLHTYLAEHPRIDSPATKEVHYFDLNAYRPTAWYRGHFPPRRPGRIAGEASPYYLFHPVVPERVARLLPDAKLIVLLRDPVHRAYSQYQHQRAYGFESLSFSEALAQEPKRLAGEAGHLVASPHHRSYAHQHHSYFARGLYADQLEAWFAHLPRERFFIGSSEEFFADPAATLAEVQSFLGLDPHLPQRLTPRNTRDYEPLDPALRSMLSERYRPHNDRLYELLGRDFGWS